jgi:signal transduction histidine kinase
VSGLETAIKDVIKPFSLDIERAKLQVDIKEKSPVPKAFALDTKLYREILFNIIYNAVKFNKPNGSIKIDYSFDERTNSLITKVTDTGIGISARKQSKLFHAFKGSVRSTFEKQESFKSGVGIGLSNSKALAEYLSGQIELQSKFDQGTSVTFSVKIRPIILKPSSVE